MNEHLNFACDYNQGAHPAILKRMLENNLVKSGVYGDDAFSESARANGTPVPRRRRMSGFSSAGPRPTPRCWTRCCAPLRV